jgi:hypothetical protein
LAVTERVTLNAGLAFFWRQSLRDGIYSINVVPLRAGQQSRARLVGSLPSVRLDWRINRHWSCTTVYSYFNTGRFCKNRRRGGV